MSSCKGFSTTKVMQCFRNHCIYRENTFSSLLIVESYVVDYYKAAVNVLENDENSFVNGFINHRGFPWNIIFTEPY